MCFLSSFVSLYWISYTKSSTFVNIHCNYTLKDVPGFGNISVCEVVNKVEIKVDNILCKISNPTTGLINGEYVVNFIESFVAKSKEIHYLPTQLGTKLPDLIEIVINYSKLKEISSNSLETFKELRFLDLRWNEIIVLESFLFKNNEHLKFIWLSFNKIQYINPAAFDDLQHLDLLELTGNVCYSFKSTTIQDIKNIQNKSLCSSELVQIIEELNNKNVSSKQLLDQINQSICYLGPKESHSLECINSPPGHNLLPMIVICALLLVIIILIQLIICSKNFQSDAGQFKDESQELKQIYKNDSSGFIDDSSVYEEIAVKSTIVNSEDVYSEVADNKGTELKIKSNGQENSIQIDETYSETYELNRN